MLSTILSLAILSASALDSPTWSAICRVWSIAASNALRAISLCLARTCCGSPLGLKLRAMTSATLAASIISFCLVGTSRGVFGRGFRFVVRRRVHVVLDDDAFEEFPVTFFEEGQCLAVVG